MGGEYAENFWWGGEGGNAAGTLKPLPNTRPLSTPFCTPILDRASDAMQWCNSAQLILNRIQSHNP